MRMFFILFVAVVVADKFDEDNYGVKFADECEVCKIVSAELDASLAESGKKHGVLETGYSIEKKEKKKTKYAVSELRLVETLESVCDRLLTYNVHKERKDHTRFARGTSETFQALRGLVNKGVKVDIGIPEQLWDKPSAEISHLKAQCETLLERHEDDIENWYFRRRAEFSIEDYLCRQRALKTKEDKYCLENAKGEEGESEEKGAKTKKSKKKKKMEL